MEPQQCQLQVQTGLPLPGNDSLRNSSPCADGNLDGQKFSELRLKNTVHPRQGGLLQI